VGRKTLTQAINQYCGHPFCLLNMFGD